MVNIKEVARAAGVSTATVSRVLAGSPHVRPEARERVLAAVAQLEYRPNLVARSLRSQHSHLIGLIVSDIRNPFFPAISRAVEDIAYAHGMGVALCNTDDDPQKEAIYLNLMRDTRVAGIILSPSLRMTESRAPLRFDVPLVAIDRALPHADVDTVLLDNVGAARQLTTHLIDNGYQRIGALFGSSATGRERRQGYEEALRARGLEPAAELARQVEPKMAAGYAATLEVLDVSPRADTLITGNSLLAAGAWRAIRERGLAIPDDIALASFDESTWEELIEPPLTVIAQPTYEIGKAAAELLFQRVSDPQRPARQVILRGRLLPRGSSARRRAALETHD